MVKDLEGIDILMLGQRVIERVVRIQNGDTATVLSKDKQQFKIRFNSIDAPELKMDFGNKSKKHLSDLILGKKATVLPCSIRSIMLLKNGY
jgi:endonuclease YncB( thermonuclease family)